MVLSLRSSRLRFNKCLNPGAKVLAACHPSVQEDKSRVFKLHSLENAVARAAASLESFRPRFRGSSKVSSSANDPILEASVDRLSNGPPV
mmetsp:Transcript_139142/g.259450  ORF Transcript_139142/g.259450 Transcript_139142/m.259450 type:complete len:90 (+) Transcript_139142:2792-3061(+)